MPDGPTPAEPTDSPSGEQQDPSPLGDTDSTTDNPLAPGSQGVVEPEPETFDRAYVRRLRDENAKARLKAKRADELARELFRHRVAALGRLADPTDLAYTDGLFDADRPQLEAAVDELLTRKPHLADRRPRGDVDQGARASSDSVDLAGMLRSRAG